MLVHVLLKNSAVHDHLKHIVSPRMLVMRQL